jgi:bacterioferritin
MAVSIKGIILYRPADSLDEHQVARVAILLAPRRDPRPILALWRAALGRSGERVARPTCSLSYADRLKTDSIVAYEIRNMATGKENAMARTFQFDVEAVVKQLNRILQMELAAVIYYTHYSFMIYGHARIPITSWLRDNASESLAHAQEAGQMIMRLHKRPALGIAALPTTQHNTIDEILAESIQREEAGVELYRELLALVKDKSVVLEEYATRLVSAEAVHLREMELMAMQRAPD